VSTQKWEMPKRPIVHQLPLLISIKHLEIRHSIKPGWKRIKSFEMASRFNTPDIPLIDFSPFLHGSAQDRAQVASSIDKAFKSCDFMYLRNHGIDQRTVDECFEWVRKFVAPVFRTPKSYQLMSTAHRASAFLA
jgi:hypothetical protein